MARAVKTVTVLINGNVYEMSKTMAANMINQAKKLYENKSAIVAVEQLGRIEMRKDEFPFSSEMYKQITELKSNGFKVHYVRRW